MKNPLRLTRESVILVHDNESETAQSAGVTEAVLGEEDKKHYTIRLFYKFAYALYQESTLASVFSFDTFLFSVLCHEVGHITGGSFQATWHHMLPYNDIAKMLDNIVEDARIEYHFMREYPYYAKYVQALLSSVCYRFANDRIEQSNVSFDIKSVYYLARFGVIVDGADKHLMQLALPLLISSMHGTRTNTQDAVVALYHYLADKYSGTGEERLFQLANWGVKTVNLTQQEQQRVKNGQQVIANQHASGFQEQHVAGDGGEKLCIEERTGDFYEATVSAYAQTIAALKSLFLRYKYTPRRVRAYEGDCNFKRQQEAYLTSLTGEVGKDAYVWKRMLPSKQVCLFYDISSSTRDFQEKYCQAIVCLLASLEGEEGVELACIAFNNMPFELLRFGESVRQGRFYPHAEGGTMLSGPLAMAFGGEFDLQSYQGYRWHAREQHVIIVTDGDIYDWDICEQRIAELRSQGVHVSFLDVAQDSVEMLPEKVMVEICQ